MEYKVWILGDGTSQPGLCPLFCLGGKTCRLGVYRTMSKKLALIVHVLPSGVSPGYYEEKAPLVENRSNIPFLRDLANRLREERQTLKACTGESSW